ncbi:MAG: cyclase family protein, partial [Chloroflexota bacterium]|nr:cyclase family protein [Chloroflexota bacterium]
RIPANTPSAGGHACGIAGGQAAARPYGEAERFLQTADASGLSKLSPYKLASDSLDEPMKLYDLSQPLYEGTSRMFNMPSPTIATLPAGRAHVQQITSLSHIGTHVDAPLHVIPTGASLDQLRLEQFVGPAAVVDVRTAAVEAISAADLERGAGALREGDIALLCTGWAAKFGTPEYDPHPYLVEESARWLVRRGVRMVALDTLTPDLPGPLRPASGYQGVVHQTLLGNGVLILENLADVTALIGRRLWVVAAPINIRGGDGGFVRVIATEIDAIKLID